MTILFLGNFEPPFSSENYYKRTLTEMGHTVITAQERVDTKQDLSFKLNNNKVDAFFWVHTHGFRTNGIMDFLAECKVKGIVTFAYHLDLYLGIEREKELWTDPFFTVDYFFTVDKLMADWLNENTSCKGVFLPAGVYEGECFLGTPNREKYPHDIIFTGSYGYHKEYPYRQQLINWLRQNYGANFGHYGGGGLPTVRGPELNNLYASAKVVIGDTLCKDFSYPWYSSDRLFEATGRGAFVIYPHIHGIDNWFKPGSEILTYNYGNFDMLKAFIEDALANDVDREKIKLAGYERCRKNHTYRHRFEEILKVIAR